MERITITDYVAYMMPIFCVFVLYYLDRILNELRRK
jgi:hypothetical protein